MKYRIKETGEIIDNLIIVGNALENHSYIKYKDNHGEWHMEGFSSLAKILEKFEEYEGPKEYWCVDCYKCGAKALSYNDDDIDKFNKSIGNYFKNEEEAKEAVEKLKAWQRLKDNGFKFTSFYNDDEYCKYKPADDYDGMSEDLNLLFRGKK